MSVSLLLLFSWARHTHKNEGCAVFQFACTVCDNIFFKYHKPALGHEEAARE